MEQALNRRWVDKDPRLCITYAAFAHILLRRVVLAAIVRDPLEVATSLYLRNAMPIERGLALWFLYNHHLAFQLQDGDQLFDYQQLHTLRTSTQEFNGVLAAINHLLMQTRQPLLSQEQFEVIARRRISPELNRSSSGLPAAAAAELPASRLLPLCTEALAHWRSCSEPISGWREAFGSIPFVLSQVLSQQGDIGGMQATNQAASVAASVLEQPEELAALRERLAAMEGCTSWRLTGPLRWLGDRLRG
jgi:hypothetical protein